MNAPFAAWRPTPRLRYSGPVTDSESPAPKHSLAEDIFAIVTGTLFISFGVVLFKKAGLLTGGTSGVALLVYYLTAIPFGLGFFVINLPFYVLSLMRMGWRFTIKTFCAVALVSVLSETHGYFIEIGRLEPAYAAVFGGLLFGIGFIVLFRHQASLGGVNILALYLQDRFGIRAGKLQLGIDLVVLIASLLVVDWKLVALSVLGSITLNLVIWMNHRRDRYVAWSAA
jgi:uncharacterized membrane-anchored protein YitT (DUF2179 family)